MPKPGGHHGWGAKLGEREAEEPEDTVLGRGWGGGFSGFFFVWGCPRALCMQKQALTLVGSSCLPAPPGSVQAPGDGEAARHCSVPRTARPAPDGSIRSSLGRRFVKKRKGFFLGINHLVTETINSHFGAASSFHGPGCRETRDAGFPLVGTSSRAGWRPSFAHLLFHTRAQLLAQASSWGWRDDLRSLPGKN